MPQAATPANATPLLDALRPIDLWGLPLAPLNFDRTLDAVDELIASGEPGYFITANLHYAMLSDADPRLAEVNRDAAFLLADGMPMVWWSRLTRRRLPQRVAGSDLVYALCQRAAERGHRIFLLGAAPGIADEAAARLVELYPGLKIAGVEVPPFREMTSEENARMVQRIRNAAPDVLFAALGQPKGEFWLHENYRRLGVPACVQIGASLDFVVGRVRRAPRWMQRCGLEWAWRVGTQPRRLGPRYVKNALFLLKAVARDLRAARHSRSPRL